MSGYSSLTGAQPLGLPYLHGRILMKRFPWNSKYEVLVDEVELLEANPQYAHIRKSDGSEATVSLKHLAQKGYESSGFTKSSRGWIYQ